MKKVIAFAACAVAFAAVAGQAQAAASPEQRIAALEQQVASSRGARRAAGAGSDPGRPEDRRAHEAGDRAREAREEGGDDPGRGDASSQLPASSMPGACPRSPPTRLLGTWNVVDQIAAATQAGKVYFGPQAPVNDFNALPQAIQITRQVHPALAGELLGADGAARGDSRLPRSARF